MRLKKLSLPIAQLLLALSIAVVSAQGQECGAALVALWTAASNACINGPSGAVCNGGSPPQAEPTGPVSNALAAQGALVEAGVVDALHTPPIDLTVGTFGIAWLRLSAPTQATALLVGEVAIRDVTPPESPAWTSMLVQTPALPPTCSAAPDNTLIIQSLVGQSARLTINGASLALNGTVAIRTGNAETHFVALSGQSSVAVSGATQSLMAGQEIILAHAPNDWTQVMAAAPPQAIDTAPFQTLPLALLPRAVVLSQSGFARTESPVNLRTQPSEDAGVILQVPAAQVMNVLGQNPEGSWLHVRLESGQTGWMLAELLSGAIGAIPAVYEATPLPPERYGEVSTTGRILAPAGVSLRQGPDAGFPVVASLSDGTLVQLVARSPYSQWVKVDSNGTMGWVALITLETQAHFDMLPVDTTVSPPPAPTRAPGSFGNAFPDPNLPGNP